MKEVRRHCVYSIARRLEDGDQNLWHEGKQDLEKETWTKIECHPSIKWWINSVGVWFSVR